MNFICDKNHKHIDKFGCFADWASRLERLERENEALRARSGVTGSVLYTKFKIGQQVWKASTNFQGEKNIPCGGCAGTSRAKVVGMNETVNCPKCRGEGMFWGPYKNVGYVNPLTVGMIRAETWGPYKYQESGSHKTEYRCAETGIGSGNVWTEDVNLFATKAEAQDAADAMAIVKQIKWEETHVFDESIHAWRSKEVR